VGLSSADGRSSLRVAFGAPAEDEVGVVERYDQAPVMDARVGVELTVVDCGDGCGEANLGVGRLPGFMDFLPTEVDGRSKSDLSLLGCLALKGLGRALVVRFGSTAGKAGHTAVIEEDQQSTVVGDQPTPDLPDRDVAGYCLQATPGVLVSRPWRSRERGLMLIAERPCKSSVPESCGIGFGQAAACRTDVVQGQIVPTLMVDPLDGSGGE